MPVLQTANELVNEINEEVIKWRRYFHQYPELSYQEEKTSQFVIETLQSFEGLTVTRPTKTSVMAQLTGSKPGKVLAMRADMDALPIVEETKLPFASKNPGVMHACGHDGHTAMLLGAAKVLSQMQSSINGEIRFIFQHAEEKFPGGAKEMVGAGVLEGVDEIIGLHLFSMFPVGKIGICPEHFTANDDTFEIVIVGKGGHAAQPENTIDPITIGAEVVSNLQYIIARNSSPSDKAVVSITEIEGGTAKNIIPNTIKLGGGARSFSKEVRKNIEVRIEEIVKGITEAHNASYDFDYVYGYDSVYNDPDITGKIENIIKKEFSTDHLLKVSPLMVGEDFSGFLKEVPGCFIGIGAAYDDDELNYPHHHSKFSIDEKSLEIGLKLLVNSAIRLLKD